MATIAFIGLGIMGLPMAGHLVDAGHKVVGYNRSADRTRQLVERGGVAAESNTSVKMDKVTIGNK